MKKNRLLLVFLISIGYIQLLNAQESNYCEISIRANVFTKSYSCKYYNYKEEYTINTPNSFNKYDLEILGICDLVDNPTAEVSMKAKCSYNSILMLSTIYRFFSYQSISDFIVKKCYGESNPENFHAMLITRNAEKEVTLIFNEADIEGLINLNKKYSETTFPETYSQIMERSLKDSLGMLKDSCN